MYPRLVNLGQHGAESSQPVVRGPKLLVIKQINFFREESIILSAFSIAFRSLATPASSLAVMSSATDLNDDQTEIIICGGGPTGALLSAMLGLLDIPNVVLEREAHITTDPRGIALDEDGIRSLQAIGIYDSIYTKIGRRTTFDLLLLFHRR